MAPEMFFKKYKRICLTYDQYRLKYDIFRLGIILLQMLMGIDKYMQPFEPFEFEDDVIDKWYKYKRIMYHLVYLFMIIKPHSPHSY